MKNSYVHGYDPREHIRLQDQASTLAEILHSDTFYPEGSIVLEAGCGVGAQTVTLASSCPGAVFVSVDISLASLAQARKAVRASGAANVSFQQADIMHPPFAGRSFDHVFACFVLEHLPHPVDALVSLRRLIRPGGTITVIEGDHGSVFFHPDSEKARRAIRCQIELQSLSGGNALIGRELYPLLCSAGFRNVQVSPRMVYIDAGKPGLVEGFTKKTFTAMIEGVKEKALACGLTDSASFDQGVRDLYRTTEPDGVFCYTFFKARADTC
jgi:SAM-dependent methyltransferase